MPCTPATPTPLGASWPQSSSVVRLFCLGAAMWQASSAVHAVPRSAAASAWRWQAPPSSGSPKPPRAYSVLLLLLLLRWSAGGTCAKAAADGLTNNVQQLGCDKLLAGISGERGRAPFVYPGSSRWLLSSTVALSDVSRMCALPCTCSPPLSPFSLRCCRRLRHCPELRPGGPVCQRRGGQPRPGGCSAQLPLPLPSHHLRRPG